MSGTAGRSLTRTSQNSIQVKSPKTDLTRIRGSVAHERHPFDLSVVPIRPASDRHHTFSPQHVALQPLTDSRLSVVPIWRATDVAAHFSSKLRLPRRRDAAVEGL